MGRLHCHGIRRRPGTQRLSFDKQERFLSEIVRLMGELLTPWGMPTNTASCIGTSSRPTFSPKSGQAKVGDFGIARIESST